MTLRIVVAGAAGRMGSEVAAAAVEDPEVAIVGGIVRPGSPAVGQPWAAAAGAPLIAAPSGIGCDADVLIDFTTPEAAVAQAEACAAAGWALVCGTTGLTGQQMDALRAAARSVPVLYARNMSLGVQAVVAVVPLLARALAGYDVEIVEAHHRHKADAPSGTALALAEAVAGATGGDLEERAVHGRRGHAPRRVGEIGIHAVRAGGNAGEHTVILADEGEEVRLVHRAYGRRTFARGALRAARFVAGRPPGWYSIADVVAAASAR